ncbi:MAG: cytochrome c-type biosis protein CcmH [Actinomycetota bacterium]|jgi:cytochrome c-type biogenesis protein CcmH|nr:cytochrome c-type biosis protein CcmH [Actinomycetota bacterium]
MLVVLALSLAVGASGSRSPRTEADRVNAIASEVRCPTCRSLSAAESDAKAAGAVKEEIRTRLRAGQSDAEIRGYLASRYGKDILLRPDATGLAGLVWSIPVALLLVALAGLFAAFRRWRGVVPPPTDEERALVEEALRSS